jgi:hypothetical protein
MMSVKYIIAVLVTCSASIAHAQDGPSYEETISFLTSKVNVTRNLSGDTYNTYRFEELERCVFSYASDQFMTDGPNGTQYTTARRQVTSDVEIDFSELDPSSTEVSSGGIDVRTREGREVISYRTSFHPAFWDYAAASREDDVTCRSDGTCFERRAYFDGASFNTFDASNNAPRVASALTHLIQICGGREELF